MHRANPQLLKELGDTLASLKASVRSLPFNTPPLNYAQDSNWRVRLPNKLPRGFSMWEFSPQEIAAALTAIEVDLMKAVPIEELTNSAWNCRESEQLASTVVALRAWGAQVSLWVCGRGILCTMLIAIQIATEIIKGLTPMERARGIESFITVAKVRDGHCRVLGLNPFLFFSCVWTHETVALLPT